MLKVRMVLNEDEQEKQKYLQNQYNIIAAKVKVVKIAIGQVIVDARHNGAYIFLLGYK